MDLTEIAAALNLLADFCGPRDTLQKADALLFFGGSVAGGIDTAAELFRAGWADRLILVGGQGHTTDTLRQIVHERYPQIETAGKPEAEIFRELLWLRHGLSPDALETQSTNCGNNVTNALALMKALGYPVNRLIVMQDASMQRRMAAGFAKYSSARIIQYASWRSPVVVKDGRLAFLDEDPWGLWTVERFADLLLGEIPRLMDDEKGYGPRGTGFIAHVDIPADVRQAHHLLQKQYGAETRWANPAYASRP